jgi:hypothetical protein
MAQKYEFKGWEFYINLSSENILQMNSLQFRFVLFLFVVFISSLDSIVHSQETDKKFGLRYAYAYNQKIDHHGIYFIGHVDKQLQVYIGPEVSVIRPSYFSDQANLFEEKAIGVGFGLRHKFLEVKPWGRFYGQFHFSGVPVKHYSFPGLGGLNTQRKLKVENTVALGMELDLSSFASFTFGAGFGSNEGFFLILSSFMPHAHVGIELRF